MMWNKRFVLIVISMALMACMGSGDNTTPTPDITSTPIPAVSCVQPLFSAALEDGDNVAANAGDGRLDTRWSGNGSDGSIWLQMDCGGVTEALGVELAFYNGDTRTASFKLAVSNDGSDWTEVSELLTSAGTTLEKEYFAFDALTSFRYLRFLGFGANVSSWNSVTEMSLIVEGDDIPAPVPTQTPTPAASDRPERNFTPLYTYTLDADGVDTDNAYELIQTAFGSGAIEAPDLFDGDHESEKHLFEDNDSVVGDHFKLVVHRDLDGNKGEYIDRQRNEIKVYGSSNTDLKGYQDDIFEYRWKFKINAEMELSSKFSHFFQLKAVGNDEQQPIVTLTGIDLGSSNQLQLRYNSTSDSSLEYLATNDFSLVAGEWVDIFFRGQFSNNGFLEFMVTRLSDGAVVFDVYEADIDLWRGIGDASDFVRPKWGIYRSIVETDSLRADEEDVRIANIAISKVLEVVE